MKRTLLLSMVALILCVVPVKAETLVANFDIFEEGAIGFTFQDGGITFSENDPYSSLQPPGIYTLLTADDVSEDGRFIGFSSPNVLTCANGYVPGPTGGAGRFGSLRISFDGLASMASTDIFLYGGLEYSENQLSFQAFLNGILVAEEIIHVPQEFGFHILQPAISNVLFDDLRLVSSGPFSSGASFLAMDNVEITLVPEPATLLLLGMGGLLMRKRK